MSGQDLFEALGIKHDPIAFPGAKLREEADAGVLVARLRKIIDVLPRLRGWPSWEHSLREAVAILDELVKRDEVLSAEKLANDLQMAAAK